MKILAVEPVEGGSIGVLNHCVDALSHLGVNVTVFKGSIFYQALKFIKEKINKRKHSAMASMSRFLDELVLCSISDFSPDVVFLVSHSPFFSRSFAYCKSKNIITVCWFVEDCVRNRGWQKLAPECDFFFVIQKEPVISYLRRVCKNVEYLPLAANPKVHRPISLTNGDKAYWGSNISFVGAGYPNRVFFFEKLLQFDFKIWGNEWDWAENSPLKFRIQEGGRRLSVEEYVKVFNASKINLNLHSSMNPSEIGKGDFVNPRTFEIAACRAFQIVDRRTLLGELFQPNEVVSFGSMHELLALVETFLKDDMARSEYATKAYRRVLQEHTYVHRMKKLMAYIEGRA